MKKLLAVMLVMVLAIGTFAVTASAWSYNDAWANEVLRLVNVERARAGLRPLAPHPNLNRAAQVRTREIDDHPSVGGYWSHTRPDGRNWITVFNEVTVSGRRISGENLARGHGSPAHVVQGWMNSPGHRNNIMHPHFTHMGVGVHRGVNGRMHWAQLFSEIPNLPGVCAQDLGANTCNCPSRGVNLNVNFSLGEVFGEMSRIVASMHERATQSGFGRIFN
ncbi:MAG: CAP domain-containing protein [Oscillospiraceae bacterium]|nr:CAP domain-containing protein [Oscillospiraceae bacterium]